MYDSVDEKAIERLEVKVEALRRPELYPESVEAVEAIETHMAWVFLTDAHAYKMKKPIRSSWFDYTTVKRRRSICETEVELNRRLAQDVYLDVVPLTKSEDQWTLEGEGEANDWLVKMRRLPRRKMLDRRIAKSTVRPVEIERLAGRLTRFYDAAEQAGMSPAEYRGRIIDDIESKRRSLQEPRYGLERADIDAAVGGLEVWLSDDADLLGQRAGRVVDAHGDLRPEHICLERPPVVIDCLEFARSLRLLDPVSELCFLSLECRRLGAGSWLGAQLLDCYAGLANDRPPRALISFYKSYHALVRAAVAVWHLDDTAVADRGAWRHRAQWYLRAVQRLL